MPSRRLRFELWPTVVVALLLPGLLALGRWQLERAAEKRALLATLTAAANAAPVAYRPGLPRFTRVHVAGRWDERQFLLDAQVRAGRAGYRVLTPLALADGSLLLVDRGWVGGGGAAPRAIPAADPATGAAGVEGIVDQLPEPGLRAGAAAPQVGWPRVVLYPTQPELAAALGATLQPGLVRLTRGAPGLESDAELAPLLAGAIGFPPERHLGYAVTWFALAATLVLLWLVHAARERDGEGR